MANPADEYLEHNRRGWDARAGVHARAAGYGLQRLIDDPRALSQVVEFDRPRLGRLDGLDVVHLQCHVGTDTVSLSRLGARSTTGLDLSPSSLVEARRLAAACAADIRFVEADVYSAPAALGAHYDVVYTGIGAIGWLPSIERWAATVATLLRPGGRLFIRDAHPMMYAIEDLDHYEQLLVDLPYFEVAEPLVAASSETYVATDESIEETTWVEWNHGIGDILTAILGHGMRITQFVEHMSAPWDALPGLTVAIEGGEYQLADRPERVPMTFTLQAVKE